MKYANAYNRAFKPDLWSTLTEAQRDVFRAFGDAVSENHDEKIEEREREIGELESQIADLEIDLADLRERIED